MNEVGTEARAAEARQAAADFLLADQRRDNEQVGPVPEVKPPAERERSGEAELPGKPEDWVESSLAQAVADSGRVDEEGKLIPKAEEETQVASPELRGEDKEIEKLRAQLKQERAAKEELREELRRQGERVTQLEAQVKELNETIAAFRQQVEELQQQLYEARTGDKDKTIERLQRRIAELEKEGAEPETPEAMKAAAPPAEEEPPEAAEKGPEPEAPVTMRKAAEAEEEGPPEPKAAELESAPPPTPLPEPEPATLPEETTEAPPAEPAADTEEEPPPATPTEQASESGAPDFLDGFETQTPKLRTLEQIRKFLRNQADNPEADPVALVAASLRLAQEARKIKPLSEGTGGEERIARKEELDGMLIIEAFRNKGRFRKRGQAAQQLLKGYVAARLDQVGRNDTYDDFDRAVFLGEKVLAFFYGHTTTFKELTGLRQKMVEAALDGKPLDNKWIKPDYRLVGKIKGNLRRGAKKVTADHLIRLDSMLLKRTLPTDFIETERWVGEGEDRVLERVDPARLVSREEMEVEGRLSADQEEALAKIKETWEVRREKEAKKRSPVARLSERRREQRQQQEAVLEAELNQELPETYRRPTEEDVDEAAGENLFRRRQEWRYKLEDWKSEYDWKDEKGRRRYNFSTNKLAALIIYGQVDPNKLPEYYQIGLSQSKWDLDKLKKYWRRRYGR